MLLPAEERFEPLQDAVHDEGVVVVADCNQVSVALLIARQLGRAVRVGYIDADRASSNAFDHFDESETFHAEDAKVAIITRRDYPVLAARLSYSKRDNVVDLPRVESQDHVRVHILSSVLVVAHDVVKAPVGIHSMAESNALMDVLEALVNQLDGISDRRTKFAALFLTQVIIPIKVKVVHCSLKHQNDLLPRILLELRAIVRRDEVLRVDLCVEI